MTVTHDRQPVAHARSARRLLLLRYDEVYAYRDAVRRGDRRSMPGAVRASGSLSTTVPDVDRLLAAVDDIANGGPPAVTYTQDPRTGDYWPRRHESGLDRR